MYKKLDKSLRWRKRLLVASYLIFILAEGGEIFFTLNSKTKLKLESSEIEKRIEMPPHIPEESKVDFLRNLKIIEKPTQEAKISSG